MPAKYPNSGSIHNNANNPKAKTPYGGSGDITCPHCGAEAAYWINAWVKDGSNGKFFSLSFRAKESQPEPAPRASLKGDLDDEIPF